jgi:hypothetical protein
MRGKATSWVELVTLLLLLGPTVGSRQSAQSTRRQCGK